MKLLLPLLPFKPWRVFAGDLSLIQIAGVIQGSALHLCGDTGTLHLALMTGTRTVAWFWPNPGRTAWAPEGRGHRTIVGHNESGRQYLCGIGTGELVQAVQAVLTETEVSPPLEKTTQP